MNFLYLLALLSFGKVLTTVTACTVQVGTVPACGSIKGTMFDSVKAAVKRWDADISSPNGGQGHFNDATIYKNVDCQLPVLSPTGGNFYEEYGLLSGRDPDFNTKRAVISNKGKVYLTFDHYKSFCQANDASVWLKASFTGDLVEDEVPVINHVHHHVHHHVHKDDTTPVADVAAVGAVAACGTIKGTMFDSVKAAVKRWNADISSPNGGQGHFNDATIYRNADGQLPVLSPTGGNFYEEYGLLSGRDPDFNTKRAVISNKGKVYLTFDHYRSFCQASDASVWLKSGFTADLFEGDL